MARLSVFVVCAYGCISSTSSHVTVLELITCMCSELISDRRAVIKIFLKGAVLNNTSLSFNTHSCNS